MKKRSEQESKILEIAVRYKFSYEELYEKLPLWKKEIIKNNTGQYHNDRVVCEFAHDVCAHAEKEK